MEKISPLKINSDRRHCTGVIATDEYSALPSADQKAGRPSFGRWTVDSARIAYANTYQVYMSTVLYKYSFVRCTSDVKEMMINVVHWCLHNRVLCFVVRRPVCPRLFFAFYCTRCMVAIHYNTVVIIRPIVIVLQARSMKFLTGVVSIERTRRGRLTRRLSPQYRSRGGGLCGAPENLNNRC